MAMPKMGRCQGFTLGLTTDYKCGGQGASRGLGKGLVLWLDGWGWAVGSAPGVGWLVCCECFFLIFRVSFSLETKHFRT